MPKQEGSTANFFGTEPLGEVPLEEVGSSPLLFSRSPLISSAFSTLGGWVLAAGAPLGALVPLLFHRLRAHRLVRAVSLLEVAVLFL